VKYSLSDLSEKFGIARDTARLWLAQLETDLGQNLGVRNGKANQPKDYTQDEIDLINDYFSGRLEKPNQEDSLKSSTAFPGLRPEVVNSHLVLSTDGTHQELQAPVYRFDQERARAAQENKVDNVVSNWAKLNQSLFSYGRSKGQAIRSLVEDATTDLTAVVQAGIVYGVTEEPPNEKESQDS
jgi:hypothetical protein